MKLRRSDVISKVSRIPDIRFEDQEDISLTSFAGLVIYQSLFSRMKLRQRLRECFRHLALGSIYSFWRVFLWLLVHLLLGYRTLRDRDFYAEDPLVLRVLGLCRLPDTSTISRVLAAVDAEAVENLRRLSRDIVLDRLVAERIARFVSWNFPCVLRHSGLVNDGRVDLNASTSFPRTCRFSRDR